MTDCFDCIYRYYESDTNYKTCLHPDYNEDDPDTCPGYYSEADAKADAKLSKCDKY